MKLALFARDEAEIWQCRDDRRVSMGSAMPARHRSTDLAVCRDDGKPALTLLGQPDKSETKRYRIGWTEWLAPQRRSSVALPQPLVRTGAWQEIIAM